MAARGCDITIFAEHDVVPYGTEAGASALARRTQVLALPQTCVARLRGAIQILASQWPKLPWKSLNAVRYGRRAASLRLFFEATACVNHPPFDVVHCHFGPNGIRAAALREIGAIRTRVLLTSFYGYDVSEFIRRRNPYSRLFRQCEWFLPLSEAMRERLISIGCPKERILIHRLGVTPSTFPGRARCGGGPVQIVSIARLVEKKGLEYGIRAVAHVVKARGAALRYSIVGEGPLRLRLEELISSLGLQGVVRLAGWHDRTAVRQDIAESDILLAPSVTSHTGDEEGTPTAILEAMGSGLPVVATFHGGIPELVADGVSGILVRERDTDATSSALIRLIDDAGLRRSMGLAGREFVSRLHDIERLNDRLLEIYREAGRQWIPRSMSRRTRSNSIE